MKYAFQRCAFRDKNLTSFYKYKSCWTRTEKFPYIYFYQMERVLRKLKLSTEEIVHEGYVEILMCTIVM